jgi:RNA polymerase sigma-70 factor (ECF subfamily)
MSAEGRAEERSRWEESTSRSLLAKARQDDPAAWARLVHLYAPLVAAWFRRWGVSEQDVMDLLQEVFAAVASHLTQFRKERPSDTFRGWLATIARNKLRDFHRRRAHQPVAVGGTEATRRLAQVVDPAADDDVAHDLTDDDAFSEVLARALEAIRGEFQQRTWRAFWMVVVEGRSAADAAAELKMQPGAVRVCKSRVLMRLRRELGDAGG